MPSVGSVKIIPSAEECRILSSTTEIIPPPRRMTRAYFLSKYKKCYGIRLLVCQQLLIVLLWTTTEQGVPLVLLWSTTEQLVVADKLAGVYRNTFYISIKNTRESFGVVVELFRLCLRESCIPRLRE